MISNVSIPSTLARQELVENLGEIISAEGVAVITGHICLEQAVAIRAQVRNLLVPSIPLRALRLGAEAALSREKTPNILQRRPVSINRNNAHRYFTQSIMTVLSDIDTLNEELLGTDSLTTKLDTTSHKISRLILNRFAAREEFEKHQDARSNTGLTFILQTSPTLWHIHPEGPRQGMPQLDFQTNAGDLVVMAAATDSGAHDSFRHEGFTDFNPLGSIVHSGENLTDRNRFTLALFSSPAVS